MKKKISEKNKETQRRKEVNNIEKNIRQREKSERQDIYSLSFRSLYISVSLPLYLSLCLFASVSTSFVSLCLCLSPSET